MKPSGVRMRLANVRDEMKRFDPCGRMCLSSMRCEDGCRRNRGSRETSMSPADNTSVPFRHTITWSPARKSKITYILSVFWVHLMEFLYFVQVHSNFNSNTTFHHLPLPPCALNDIHSYLTYSEKFTRGFSFFQSLSGFPRNPDLTIRQVAIMIRGRMAQ